MTTFILSSMTSARRTPTLRGARSALKIMQTMYLSQLYHVRRPERNIKICCPSWAFLCGRVCWQSANDKIVCECVFLLASTETTATILCTSAFLANFAYYLSRCGRKAKNSVNFACKFVPSQEILVCCVLLFSLCVVRAGLRWTMLH